jgi:1,4-alpha-glucan branching enzyme
MPGLYMDERFGAWQVGDDSEQGAVEFKVFFPDRNKDPGQYEAHADRPTYGDPQIAGIQVVGDFMAVLGLTTWDWANGPALTRTPHAKGWVWTYRTPTVVPKNFYEYKYYVTFDDGTTRKVPDPCARYGGRENQNSGFVIGGSRPADNTVTPLAGGRKHQRDLIVYELNIDDFTEEYRGVNAPVRAVGDKLDYLQNELGINAILFLPWTAWPGAGYSWGYNPAQDFTVEYRYVTSLEDPTEKLSLLKQLVSDCHARGIHVIMDGVYNHVGSTYLAGGAGYGFPYYWLYKDPDDCPYIGQFGGEFSGLPDRNYNNGCTQEFVRDVCCYWIDEFGIDGIRFDAALYYHVDKDSRGLPQLLSDIRSHVGDPLFSLTLEYLDLSAAGVTNQVGATSYWNNELYARTFDYLWQWGIDWRVAALLNTHAGLDADKVATTYLSNHDHSHVAWQAGARDNQGAMEWYRVQPYAIVQLTIPGCPMIPNGEEFGEDYWIMENDQGSGRRVKPRRLRWDFQSDSIGQALGWLFSRLIAIRKQHAGLRSDNVYPDHWESWQTQPDPNGWGVNVAKGVLTYHRWGNGTSGALERFVIVVNFSASDQTVDVPFPANGSWQNLLDNQTVSVGDSWLRGQVINSNWGKVYFQQE